MTLPYPISSTQTDAKSPVDQDLMDSIRLDLEELDTRQAGFKTFDFAFKVNGNLQRLNTPSRLLDCSLVSKELVISLVRAYVRSTGSGTFSFDLRKYRALNKPITTVQRQFSANISSIARAGSSINTQSIARATAQVSTQSISLWKAKPNIASIIPIPGGYARVNLASAIDSDWVVGDSVTFASTTDPANSLTATIIRKNDDGLDNIIIANASAVLQTGAAGTAQLNAWSYNYTNPLNAQFVAGESAVFASHTSGANDGTFALYAVNSGGNNLIVKNASGVAQAGVAGNVNVGRFTYTYSSSVAADYVVGESALFASHSNAANDGNFPIRAVNSGGNNLIVYNPSGVVQGGVAGTANTNRWVYSLASSPASDFTAGDNGVAASTSSSANSGTFAIVEVNRSGTNNLVVYNTSGAAQGGSAGTFSTARMLVKFAADPSADITTDSKIHLRGNAYSANDGVFQVLQVNRGGGSNYNAVIENASGIDQLAPAGRVSLETKSIFSAGPQTVDLPAVSRDLIVQDYDTGFSAEATLEDGDVVGLEILSKMAGATDFMVMVG